MLKLPNFIEIETSSFCNRKCVWCPIGNTDVRTKQKIMDWELFVSIIDNLALLSFSNWLAFHNYNEPLLNNRLTKEIYYAKSELPNSTLGIFTNGDYLTNAILDKLNTSLLDYLRITLYPSSPNNKPKKENITNWWLEKKLPFINFSFDTIPQHKGINAIGKYKNLTIEVINPNVTNYNSRGETSFNFFPNYERTTSCTMTTTSAAIDYQGNFKMCCNIFADIEAHKPYIVESLKMKKFEEIWFSDKMSKLRSNHQNANWEESPICKGCSHFLRDEQVELLNN